MNPELSARRRAGYLAAAMLLALVPLGARGAARAAGPGAAATVPVRATDPLARALAEQLERAARHPDDPQVANDLGNLLALAGRPADAERAYRHAIELAPADSTAHYNLGRLLLDRGKRLAARRELKRAIALEPDNGSAWYYLGTIDDALGRRSAAHNDYVRAFRLEPGLADPRHNPDVVGNHQALAAQLEIWSHEAPVGPSRIYAQAGRIAKQAEAPPVAARPGAKKVPPGGEPESDLPATTPTEVPAAPTGGFARSTGAPPSGPGGPAEQGASPMSPRPLEGAPTAPENAPPAAPSQVIDSTSIGYGGTVNQAQPQTGMPRTSAPGMSPQSPQSPRYPVPFVAAPRSTGQIERSVEPPPAA